MTAPKILDDREFEAILKTVPASHHRLALMVHDALLRQAAAEVPTEVAPPAEDAVRQVAEWLLAEAGDADTVRANHTRKLAQRLLAGEMPVSTSPWTIADATRLLAADTPSIARNVLPLRAVKAGEVPEEGTLVFQDDGGFPQPKKRSAR